jgi:hypothetical protein
MGWLLHQRPALRNKSNVTISSSMIPLVLNAFKA